MNEAEQVESWHFLHDAFAQICDCGGRLLGTDSELQARDLLKALGMAATGVACVEMLVPYQSWRPLHCALKDSHGNALTSHPLLRSAATPPGGLEAEVVDLGHGTPEQFRAHANEIADRFVLVRHELMFAAGTISIDQQNTELLQTLGRSDF